MNVMRREDDECDFLCFRHQFKQFSSVWSSMKHQLYSVGGKIGKKTETTKNKMKKSLMISDINSNFIVESIKENCYNNFKCHFKSRNKLSSRTQSGSKHLSAFFSYL